MTKPKSARPAALIAAVCILLAAAAAAEARIVGPAEARTAAARLLEFENARPDLRLTPGVFALGRVEPLLRRGRPVAYLARLEPRGFMILSDITEGSPQVFVSYEGDPDRMARIPYLARLLDRLDYAKVQLRYLPASGPAAAGRGAAESPDREAVNRNERRWEALGRGEVAAARSADGSSSAEVTPLLATKWNQDTPFWNYTPRVGGEPTPAGCSAVAMAQVMNYWKHPAQGQGSHSYTWNGQTLSADFNHPYHWSLMRDTYYAGTYTAAQADAVARLCSDVGISIDMQYAVDGSGSYINDNDALTAFFKYSPDAHETDRAEAGSWEAWFEVIRREVEIHQPVIMAIYNRAEESGHAVVADGYRTSPSNQLHINMGWGGFADNYYSVDHIYHFGDAEWDYAVIGIHPIRIKLTLKATEGGTTVPSPGTYVYPYGTTQIVRATAVPETHYAFTGWTGDVSGTQNPVDIVVDMEKTATANFLRNIYAPLSASGQKILNRSFSQAEYINLITFEPNPDNVDIKFHRLYEVEGTKRTEIALLETAVEFQHRGVLKDKTYTYHIVAVNSASREGAPAVLVVQ